ncbi:MAG: chemotaxis-specific protein-glutamate methyltransferase CheB [Acetatifactor sp.]|nr:chemotaxis-specific protein-glutamate methyltransferase CheB [Acetatifactor sp.]
MKKILVVDDSALMRRVICDIINNDGRFIVADQARDGIEALELLRRNAYDAVVLDVNMPRMNGLQLLDELRRAGISARVMMASTDTSGGAKTTLEALELGALDFVHKPDNALTCRGKDFRTEFLRTLTVVLDSNLPVLENREKQRQVASTTRKVVEIAQKHGTRGSGRKIVAIASSTGGPKSLQSVIPRLPAQLQAPVLLVQHMPKGFTASLAERLDYLGEMRVKEAEEGDELENGTVYLSRGGSHMNVRTTAAGKTVIHYSDEPNREGVKPCANYMYESLMDCGYDEIICVVLTGMGADGTEGIKNLKTKKKVHVIAQDQETCVVYGMPKSIVRAGLADQSVPLEQIAQEIILNVGVK